MPYYYYLRSCLRNLLHRKMRPRRLQIHNPQRNLQQSEKLSPSSSD
jgi:hypothetical protein